MQRRAFFRLLSAVPLAAAGVRLPPAPSTRPLTLTLEGLFPVRLDPWQSEILERYMQARVARLVNPPIVIDADPRRLGRSPDLADALGLFMVPTCSPT